jgi:hypothetical protein
MSVKPVIIAILALLLLLFFLPLPMLPLLTAQLKSTKFFPARWARNDVTSRMAVATTAIVVPSRHTPDHVTPKMRFREGVIAGRTKVDHFAFSTRMMTMMMIVIDDVGGRGSI